MKPVSDIELAGGRNVARLSVARLRPVRDLFSRAVGEEFASEAMRSPELIHLVPKAKLAIGDLSKEAEIIEQILASSFTCGVSESDLAVAFEVLSSSNSEISVLQSYPLQYHASSANGSTRAFQGGGPADVARLRPLGPLSRNQKVTVIGGIS